MTPIKFNEANKSFDRPDGEVLHFFHDGITGQIVIKYELTPEELATISLTGTLFVSTLPGQTGNPSASMNFRPTTEKEAEVISTLEKVRRTVANQMNRKPKSNAKMVSLKSIRKK